MTVTFDIEGVPAPQGGMRAVNTVRGPRLVTTGGIGLRIWRETIRRAAEDVARRYGRLDDPACVTVEFRFPMPASRPKQDRMDGQLWKTTAPDLDKLCRALGDGLTAGGLLKDDRIIVEWHATKIETVEWTGATVAIREAYPLDPVNT